MAARMKISEVRRLHDRYGEMQARWGDDNQATIGALIAYWAARDLYESQTRKVYTR